jgi:hypothetical protein
LTTEEMFSAPRLRTLVQPNLQAELRLDPLMLDIGIDRSQLEKLPGVVFCPAQLIAPSAPLVDRANDLAINDAVTDARRRGPGAGTPAAMFFQRPVRARLASFDAKSPWRSYAWLVSQMSADTSAARRRFAVALCDGDPVVIVDGGELLPMGQDEATRRLRAALQQLPASAPVVVRRQQPVTVRSYDSAGGTMILVVNECPWATDVEVMLEVPNDLTLSRLTGDGVDPTAGGEAGLRLAPGQQTWPLRLSPYDVQVARLSAGGVGIASVSARIGDAAKAEWAARVAEFRDHDLTAPSVYDRLANPGFESTATAGGGPLPGWQLADPSEGVRAELDATTPHSGAMALYLASSGPIATVQSHVMPTPATGQLFATAFVRGENLSPDTELRMVIELADPDQQYRRFIPVSAENLAAHPPGEVWPTRAFGFYVNDLPLESNGQMRIKFELNGRGEVWIDDVELQDLLFPRSYYEHQTAEKRELANLLHAVQSTLESGRVADCVRLLEGYWPRFVTAYTPRGQATAIVRQTPGVEEGNAATPEKQPSGAESPVTGLRRYLPWLR